MAELFGMQSSAPLRAAATSFEQALRLDPSLHTAALHLGRARLLQGFLDKARQNLDVATHSALPSERYLALLFLGAIAEQAGRLDEAEARYRAAVSEFKWGQSGPLALARLLSRTNREQDAREVIAAFLVGGGPTMEPLWTFIARPEQEALSLLDLLRDEIGNAPTTDSGRWASDRISSGGSATVPHGRRGCPRERARDGRSSPDQPGLTAADFELKDSRVVQEIEAATLADVPVSMALVLDTSESVKGATLKQLKNAADAAIDELGVANRVSLLTFNSGVQLTSRLDRIR